MKVPFIKMNNDDDECHLHHHHCELSSIVPLTLVHRRAHLKQSCWILSAHMRYREVFSACKRFDILQLCFSYLRHNNIYVWCRCFQISDIMMVSWPSEDWEGVHLIWNAGMTQSRHWKWIKTIKRRIHKNHFRTLSNDICRMTKILVMMVMMKVMIRMVMPMRWYWWQCSMNIVHGDDERPIWISLLITGWQLTFTLDFSVKFLGPRGPLVPPLSVCPPALKIWINCTAI